MFRKAPSHGPGHTDLYLDVVICGLELANIVGVWMRDHGMEKHKGGARAQ